MELVGRWFRAYVEQCWAQVTGEEVVRGPDGDMPFRCGTAMGWVSIVEQPFPLVRVFAYAATDVKRTAALLRELNEVNGRATTAHAYWWGGMVVVEQAVHGHGVRPEVLEQAWTAVGTVADDIGALVAAVHGGSTPFEPAPAVPDETG